MLMVFELVTGGELFDDIVSREHYNEHDARSSGAAASSCMQRVHVASLAWDLALP
jgi:hypothetical protein